MQKTQIVDRRHKFSSMQRRGDILDVQDIKIVPERMPCQRKGDPYHGIFWEKLFDFDIIGSQEFLVERVPGICHVKRVFIPSVYLPQSCEEVADVRAVSRTVTLGSVGIDPDFHVYAGLKSSRARGRDPDCLEKDNDVEPEAPVSYVVLIDLYPFPEGEG